MALFTESDALTAASRAGGTSSFSAKVQLRESRSPGTYDIFLSHSFNDTRLILGVRELLKSTGQSVYVDWIDDPELDRTQVSSRTAATLRDRMRASSSLVYAHSLAASHSKWMPWELGYFDGLKGGNKVAIMPLARHSSESTFGQEYLGLYKQVRNGTDAFGRPGLPVIRSGTYNRGLDTLVRGL